MKNILFFLITYSLTSCNNNSVTTKENQFDFNTSNNKTKIMDDLHRTRNYLNINDESPDKDYYYRGVPHLIKRLGTGGYKFPDDNTFRNSILKIFHIDIDTAHTDNISFKEGTFKIFRKDGFILFGDLYNELDSMKISRSNDMFLQLNLYLFNNSAEAKYILKEKKPKSLTSVVFDLGYAVIEDSVIADAYFKNMSMGTYPTEALTYLICNRNEDNIFSLKIDLAHYLSKHYPETLKWASFNIISPEPTTNDVYGTTFISKKVKYKCWGQLVDIGWHVHDISYFVRVFETHKDLSGFYKTHNYYGLKGLERFCKLYDKYGVEDPNKFQPQDAFWEDAPYNFEN